MKQEEEIKRLLRRRQSEQDDNVRERKGEFMLKVNERGGEGNKGARGIL